MSRPTLYEVSLGARTLQVRVRREGQAAWVSVDGADEVLVDVRRPVPGVYSVLLGDRSWDGLLTRRDDGWEVSLRGVGHACKVADPRRKALQLGGAVRAGTVTTSMPGRVVRVLVEAGQTVAAGEPVVVVEAMKMENELKAGAAGTVAEVLVAPNDNVEAGAVLVRIQTA